MLLTILLFLLGLLLIIKGGDLFVDASIEIAARSGLPKVLIGATIVSVATTLPEMTVSVTAAAVGQSDMAFGNAVGSMICNIGLILGISLLFSQVRFNKGREFRYFLAQGLFLAATVSLDMLLSRDGMLEKNDCLILIGVFFAFLLYTALNAGKLQSGELTGGPQKSMLRVAVCFIIGITAVVIGSKLLVKNGAELARLLGVSDDVISLTIIALGTSLPELVTAITALRKKNADIGIGNIIGANILNGTMVLGVSGLVSPIAVTSSNLTHDFPAAAILSVLLLAPIVFRKRSEIWQGILMLGLYIAYLIVII